jgi:methylmalonyl-CoA mutase N-terminal domain/subunit
MERLKVDPAIEQNQRARLAELRQTRDAAKVSELLGQLETAARGNENLMPLFIECVSQMITLGEITGVLRTVWGEYQTPAWG